VGVTGNLADNGSLVSVACNATPCSWTGSGFPAGDSLIWTSGPSNAGNGPLTLTFGKKVAGTGAIIPTARVNSASRSRSSMERLSWVPSARPAIPAAPPRILEWWISLAPTLTGSS
jgi:hypothetical protein